jgi:hypothetical protein
MHCRSLQKRRERKWGQDSGDDTRWWIKNFLHLTPGIMVTKKRLCSEEREGHQESQKR